MTQQFRGQKSCQNNLGRDSNIELLRLVCMLFIVIEHCMNFGLGITGMTVDSKFLPIGAIESFFIIAVDCFVLVSGYFGIKVKWKSAVHLYVVCVFYSVLLTLLSFYELGQFSIKEFIYSFLVFSNSRWWFIKCYFYLFLLSPMLNFAVESIKSKSNFIVILLIWSILTFYLGYFWSGSINPDGFNVMNFIFLYLIGRFISLYLPQRKDKKEVFKYVVGYIGGSICVSTMYLVVYYLNLDVKWVFLKCFSYNNPFVVFSAISFFLIFRSFSFKSKIINWLAASSLSIYLIHTGLRCWLFPFVEQMQNSILNGWLLALSLFLLSLCVMIVCILIDKLRIFITNPIERVVLKINWERYSDLLVKKIDCWIK